MEKYLIVSLDDRKAKVLGEVISNPSCKKIIELLADKEMSASEISSELKMPLNSIAYNLDKLVSAGVVEKIKGFLWSIKGKKIERYRVANKAIVISPKKIGIYSKLKGVVPSIVVSGLASAAIAAYYKMQFEVQSVSEKSIAAPMLKAMPSVAESTAINIQIHPWFWFAFGCLTAIVVFLAWNWKKL